MQLSAISNRALQIIDVIALAALAVIGIISMTNLYDGSSYSDVSANGYPSLFDSTLMANCAYAIPVFWAVVYGIYLWFAPNNNEEDEENPGSVRGLNLVTPVMCLLLVANIFIIQYGSDVYFLIFATNGLIMVGYLWAIYTYHLAPPVSWSAGAAIMNAIVGGCCGGTRLFKSEDDEEKYHKVPGVPAGASSTTRGVAAFFHWFVVEQFIDAFNGWAFIQILSLIGYAVAMGGDANADEIYGIIAGVILMVWTVLMTLFRGSVISGVFASIWFVGVYQDTSVLNNGVTSTALIGAIVLSILTAATAVYRAMVYNTHMPDASFAPLEQDEQRV